MRHAFDDGKTVGLYRNTDPNRPPLIDCRQRLGRRAVFLTRQGALGQLRTPCVLMRRSVCALFLWCLVFCLQAVLESDPRGRPELSTFPALAIASVCSANSDIGSKPYRPAGRCCCPRRSHQSGLAAVSEERLERGQRAHRHRRPQKSLEIPGERRLPRRPRRSPSVGLAKRDKQPEQRSRQT